MNLSDLLLNRFLYKNPQQNLETKDSTYLSENQVPTENKPVSSGDTVFDINTNSQYINGSQLNPNSPLPPGILNIANWGWTQSCNFTVASLNTVTWSAGTFTSSDGSSYAIGAGTTGVMAAKTYIYLDILASPTAYLITTSLTAPVGIGKVLIAVAQNGPTSATYVLVQATQVVADNILANTITAQKMNVGQISAISADLGSMTAGTVTGALIRTNATGTRVEMDGAGNQFVVYYGGDMRAIFSGDSLTFLGPGEVGGGSITSFGTNQLDIDVGGGIYYEFNESEFSPLDNYTQECGSNGRAWWKVSSYFADFTAGIRLNGVLIGDWSDISAGVTDVTGTYPISSSGGSTPDISIDTSDFAMLTGATFSGNVSMGSNNFRVGGHLYMNSGNNNVYIYSTGSNLSFKDSTGTYASLGEIKSAIVPTSEGYNALYCVESPEVWFMDFCDEKGKLSKMFKEVTVGPYHYIKCGGGEYQVWGRRKGHEHKRFENKTEAEFEKNNEFYSMAKVT